MERRFPAARRLGHIQSAGDKGPGRRLVADDRSQILRYRTPHAPKAI
jgi:hypothetical protein